MLGQQYSSAPYSSVHLGISDEPEGGGNCLSGIFGFGPYGSIICNEDTGGVVVDVGHGTTGVSVLANGDVLSSVDEATGGHHMTLVISGALGIDYESAEQFKRDPAEATTVIGLIRPTLEKMALIAHRATAGHEELPLYLVGGSSSHPQAAAVFEAVLGRPVTRPDEPLFPTPLGTAMRRTRN